MNLIEQLGGYEEVKKILEKVTADPSVYAQKFEKPALELELLEYRREHNIFEPGDKAVYLISEELCTVCEQEFSQNYLFVDFPDQEGVSYLRRDFRHATDEELAK